MTTMDLLGKMDLQGLDSSAEVARAYVRSVLPQADRRDMDDIELLVSEVFANAVKHSESGRRRGGVVRLRVYYNGETVRVEVTDQGSVASIPRIPEQVSPLSESGRGLWLVQKLSSSWGWGQHDKGRTVWFEVRL